MYKSGEKAYGVLKWNQGQADLTSEGTFNESGQFQGHGKLTNCEKGSYDGNFVNGYKQGKGTYEFKNGIVYEGDYQKNIRQGHGKLINPGGKIAYEGQF